MYVFNNGSFIFVHLKSDVTHVQNTTKNCEQILLFLNVKYYEYLSLSA